MVKLITGLFVLWSAVCMAFFIGLVVMALIYSPDALFTPDTLLMSFTMLFSSIAFYLVGYRKRVSRIFLGGVLVALIFNGAYLILLVEVGSSVYFVNAIFLIVLLFFACHRISNSGVEK